jgi:membrane-associated phospholipid phosphatase
MGGIESWGIAVIAGVQQLSSPAADLFFRLVTLLGDEKFYLLLLPLVYWCVDKRLGIRLAVLVMASNVINLWVKYACNLPRPYRSPEVVKIRLLGSETGPGFPSGHAQGVAVAFGYLAHRARRWGAWVAAAVLVLLVAFSRIYLAEHYPHDVLGGLAIGLAVLAIFVWAAPRVEDLWLSWPRALRYGVALGVPLILLALPVLLLGGRGTEDAAGSLGALAGFGAGGLVEGERLRFSAQGAFARRAARFVLGFLLVGIVYFGLSAAPLEGALWRFVRYACVGLVASAVAPWVFLRLGLAGSEGAVPVAGAA